MRLVLPAGIVPERRYRRTCHQAGISNRRNGVAAYPRLCTRLPFHRHRVPPQFDSGRQSGRSERKSQSLSLILGWGQNASQRSALEPDFIFWLLAEDENSRRLASLAWRTHSLKLRWFASVIGAGRRLRGAVIVWRGDSALLGLRVGLIHNAERPWDRRAWLGARERSTRRATRRQAER